MEEATTDSAEAAPSNRERVLSAAIELLGTEGLRSLTHLRIDERAELPRGSTSNVFRTRRALREGVVEAILESEMSGVLQAFEPADEAEFVESLTRLVEVLTGPARVATTARLVLFLEGSHDATLRKALSAGRGRLMDATAASLTHLGASEPRVAAEAIASTVEGIMLHRIARHDSSDPRPLLTTVVRGALSGPR